MVSTQYGLIRTIQVRNSNVPGVLGSLATAVGQAGANIGNIVTVHISQNHVVRDIDVVVRDELHLADVLYQLNSLDAVDVLDTRDEVLSLHRGGKIEMVRLTYASALRRTRTSLAFTPPSTAASRSLLTARRCLVWVI
jgi:malate dehydrogenase (oxaloacetate-decarboxylating)